MILPNETLALIADSNADIPERIYPYNCLLISPYVR